MTCPVDGNTRQAGQSVCPECADRIYQELRWLGAIYPQLLPALTQRIDRELIDRDKIVKVKGGGDPLKFGLELHEDALQLRTEIRKLAYQGLGWLLERGYQRPGVGGGEPQVVLVETARNIHWILSDDDPERVQEWACRLITARQQAEHLVTPDVPVTRVRTRQECRQGPEGDCPGELVLWGTEPVARCQINPIQHTVSRETLIYRLVTGKLAR